MIRKQLSTARFERFDTRLFGGQLADRLQHRQARRTGALLYTLLLVALGALVGWAVWLGIAPDDGGTALFFPADGGTTLALCASAFAIFGSLFEQALILSIRSAIPQDGEPFDERQQQVYSQALIDARRFVLVAMVIAILTGLYMQVAMTAGTMSYSVPLYAWICATLFFVSRIAHYLILAWQLPDEVSEEVE